MPLPVTTSSSSSPYFRTTQQSSSSSSSNSSSSPLSSWRNMIRTCIHMFSMPQEYALIKSGLLVIGTLVIIPYWFSNNIVSRGFQYQNICHVGPPLLEHPNKEKNQGGGWRSIFRRSFSSSSWFVRPPPRPRPPQAVRDLYGTYKSFEGSSYYYTQILSASIPTTNDYYNANPNMNTNPPDNNDDIPPMIIKPSGWWSITSLGFYELSPKQQQYQYQLQQQNQQLVQQQQQHYSQGEQGVGSGVSSNTYNNNNQLAANIQWDQSHKIQSKKPSSLPNSAYFREQEDLQQHSSFRNRWCIIPSGIDKEKLEQEAQEAQLHQYQLQQQQQQHQQQPYMDKYQDFDELMNVPQSSLSSQQQEFLNQDNLFQICTEPQPSIMSNGAQTPYFIELPLAPPPTQIWSLMESLIPNNNNNYYDDNDNDDGYGGENDDFIINSSFQASGGGGSASSGDSTSKMKATYKIEVQCHTPPTTLNLLSKGFMMDGSSSTSTTSSHDPQNLNEYQQEYGQFKSITSSSHYQHLLTPPPQHLWGTICIIAFLMIHTLTTNCYYSPTKKKANSGKHTKDSSTSTMTHSKSSPSSSSSGLVYLFFHGGTSNLPSQIQSQCSDATIANLTWNLTWILWIGSKLEPLWGTMVFLGVNVTCTILVSLFFVYTTSSYSSSKQQRQRAQQSNRPNNHKNPTTTTTSTTAATQPTTTKPPPRGYVWVVTILAVATAQEHPMYSLYSGSTSGSSTVGGNVGVGTTTLWSGSSGRTIIEMMQFSFLNGTIQFNILPIVIGIVHFMLWSGTGIFGSTNTSTGRTTASFTSHTTTSAGASVTTSSTTTTKLMKNGMDGGTSTTTITQSKQQQEEERQKHLQYMLFLLKAWMYCVVIGILLPHALGLMASPQWILPTALVWHLWYSTMVTHNANNGTYPNSDDNDINNDEETQHLLMNNSADTSGGDAQDSGSVWSLPSTTTTTGTNPIKTHHHKKVHSTGRLAMEQRRHLTNRPTVKYCNNDSSNPHNRNGNDLHNDDDNSGVWSLSSVSIDGGHNSSNLLQLPNNHYYKHKNGASNIFSAGQDQQQQKQQQPIPKCAIYFGKLIQFIFWIGYICVNVIGCFFLEWTLIVGHVMTLWLCCGVFLLHRYPPNNNNNNNNNNHNQNTKSTLSSRHLIMMCKLRPLWSLYHMVSATTMVVIDAMTLAGWHHAKVIIGISTYSQNYDFVWKLLACLMFSHLISFIVTASSSSWKQCTFVVPGYGLWNQAQILGQESVAWILSLLFDEDDED